MSFAYLEMSSHASLVSVSECLIKKNVLEYHLRHFLASSADGNHMLGIEGSNTVGHDMSWKECTYNLPPTSLHLTHSRDHNCYEENQSRHRTKLSNHNITLFLREQTPGSHHVHQVGQVHSTSCPNPASPPFLYTCANN